MILLLPESLQFLVLREQEPVRIRAILARLRPDLGTDGTTTFAVHEQPSEGAPVAELFRHGRARGTTLLSLITFLDLLVFYFPSNWLPTLAGEAGLAPARAVLLGTTLQLGGVIGTVVMGPLIDQVGFHRVLAPPFLAAGAAIALLGVASFPAPSSFRWPSSPDSARSAALPP